MELLLHDVVPIKRDQSKPRASPEQRLVLMMLPGKLQLGPCCFGVIGAVVQELHERPGSSSVSEQPRARIILVLDSEHRPSENHIHVLVGKSE